MISGKERNSKYVQDSKLGFIQNALYTMAYALHSMHKNLCNGSPGMCTAMSPVRGALYLKYLLNVSMVTYSNASLYFDEKGDPPARLVFHKNSIWSICFIFEKRKDA